MLAALAAIGVLLPASRAAAAKLDITPSISLDQVYDSNVFNTDGNEKEDFIFRASPALTFSLRMPETTLNLRTSITSDTYFKYTELNSSNSAISLAIDATPIRITPRFSMVPSAHFVEARDSYRRNQLMPSGDPLIQPSIASESATRKSRDYGAALRMSYLVTPKTDFSLGGGFSKLQFLDNTTVGEVGSRVITGDTALMYLFTPRFSSGLFFTATSNTFENGQDSRTVAGGATVSYRYSPSLTMTARAGASRAQESGVPGVADRTSWSPYGLFTLAHIDNTFQASLTGSVGQSGGGALGITTRRESVTLSLSDQIASRWWADLSGSYEQNRSLDAAVSGDLTSATGTAGIRHQVRVWADVRLSGTAFRQWSNGAIGTDLTRYSAFLGITLGKTYNIY
jgi:uncharacterized protein (PEP-CTERM system associated)